MPHQQTRSQGAAADQRGCQLAMRMRPSESVPLVFCLCLIHSVAHLSRHHTLEHSRQQRELVTRILRVGACLTWHAYRGRSAPSAAIQAHSSTWASRHSHHHESDQMGELGTHALPQGWRAMQEQGKAWWARHDADSPGGGTCYCCVKQDKLVQKQ